MIPTARRSEISAVLFPLPTILSPSFPTFPSPFLNSSNSPFSHPTIQQSDQSIPNTTLHHFTTPGSYSISHFFLRSRFSALFQACLKSTANFRKVPPSILSRKILNSNQPIHNTSRYVSLMIITLLTSLHLSSSSSSSFCRIHR
jgi:hypothetical protein